MVAKDKQADRYLAQQLGLTCRLDASPSDYFVKLRRDLSA